jgi:hypothetical protein
MRSEHAGGIAGRKTGGISAVTIALNVEKIVSTGEKSAARSASTDGEIGGRIASNGEKIVAKPLRSAVSAFRNAVVKIA